MKTVLVLNGPNLNLLGTREPGIYGVETLADVEARCRAEAAKYELEADCRQSNHEGVLIDCHISNVHTREEVRGHSFISPAAAGIVVGFGVDGYAVAIHGLHLLST